jgi:hypothetical protein
MTPPPYRAWWAWFAAVCWASATGVTPFPLAGANDAVAHAAANAGPFKLTVLKP